MSQERRYIPEVGARVKMRLFSDYTSRDIPLWSWLEVQDVQPELTGQEIGVEVVNGTARTGQRTNVPLSALEPPIGWKPRYTIHARPEQVEQVLSWFQRGISVRQSQYIGDGSTAFQPSDNDGQPHWKFGELTDRVPPEDCGKVFRVVKLETVPDAGIPAPCRYCNGTGVHTTNKSLEEQTANDQRCPKCGVHVHFSFTEPWHYKTNKFGSSNPEYDEYHCDEVHPPGYCWPCRGTGKGQTYLSEMKPKERKAAITQLEREGWKVWYQRRGAMWMMERETVVKDWED